MHLFFLFFLISTSSFADFADGMKFYMNRADGSEGIFVSAKNIDLAIAEFEKLLGTSEEEKAVEYYLRSCYFKSVHTKIEEDIKQNMLQQAWEMGEEVKEKYPESAAIHFWYGLCLGIWAKDAGTMKSIREGVVDKLKTAAENTITFDSTYDNGGGFRFLGALYLDVPYIPFLLSWPDDETGKEFIEKSLKVNSENISGNYYLAKAYNQLDNNDKAIEVLQVNLKRKPSSMYYLEDLATLELCKQFLEDLTK